MKMLNKIMAALSYPIRKCVQHELIQHEVRTQHRHVFRSNLEMELKRRATASSADYVLSHMKNVPSVATVEEMLKTAFAAVEDVPGKLVCEFGVHQGRTINIIASLTPQTVYGFDSFEGLPEGWYGKYKKGHFAVERLPEVRANVRLIKGWFDETLPGFVKEHPEPLSFLHVDCDLYSSTVTIFNELERQIQPGCVIVFDEYFNYPGWEEGEYKAFQEFVQRTGLKYEYLAYSRLYEQVAVKITR